jgi:hypothetical protein
MNIIPGDEARLFSRPSWADGFYDTLIRVVEAFLFGIHYEQ